MRPRRFIALAAPLALAGAISLYPLDAGADGRPLVAELTGAAEVPGPGDPDGSGFARLELNQGQEEACIEYTTQDIGEIVGAHVHRAPADLAGPIVIGFPTDGSGCVTADAELIKEIRQNPEAFYFNVHTTEFRPGAVRGQLSK